MLSESSVDGEGKGQRTDCYILSSERNSNDAQLDHDQSGNQCISNTEAASPTKSDRGSKSLPSAYSIRSFYCLNQHDI